MSSYNRFKLNLGQKLISCTSSDHFVALLTTGYVYNPDHNVFSDGTTSDPQSYEIAPTNYTRQPIANRTMAQDDSLEAGVFDGDDVVFGGSTGLNVGATIGGLVLAFNTTATTSDTGAVLAKYQSFSATPTAGATVTINWSTAGIIRIGTTS